MFFYIALAFVVLVGYLFYADRKVARADAKRAENTVAAIDTAADADVSKVETDVHTDVADVESLKFPTAL